MLSLFNYFENIINLFEEDIVDLDVSKDVKFEPLQSFLNTKLSDLRDGGCYEYGKTRFTIKVKNPDDNSYYFYNFYYTGHTEIKLVFGICTAVTKYGEEITLNKISEKQLNDDLSEITLRDIYQSHNAAVKIDIPIRVRNIFFNAILVFILNYSLINKQITYRGHLEPGEIPFARLATDVNRTSVDLPELKKIISQKINMSKKYVNEVLSDIKKYTKENNITIIKNKKDIDKLIIEAKPSEKLNIQNNKLDQEKIDTILKNVNSNIFNSIHGHITDVTFGRGGIDFNEFKQEMIDKKIIDLIEFFEFFKEKVDFFENQIQKIKADNKQDFIKQFNMSLIKLRTKLFHRDRLYRLIITRVLKLNTLLKDESIYDMSQHDDKLDVKETKNKVFDNLIKMLKRKEVQAKVILHSQNGNNQVLQPKNFILPIYNQQIHNDLKDYFELLDDNMFSKINLRSTTRMILKDISDFIINSIVINNPTGWVNVNTSSKKLLDFKDEVEVINNKIFNPRKKKITKISSQQYRNLLQK